MNKKTEKERCRLRDAIPHRDMIILDIRRPPQDPTPLPEQIRAKLENIVPCCCGCGQKFKTTAKSTKQFASRFCMARKFGDRVMGRMAKTREDRLREEVKKFQEAD